MTLSPAVRDNEQAKFRDSAEGAVVAVTLSSDYVTNDLDEVATVTYIGKSNGSAWIVQKVTESGSDLSIRYATISNNSLYTNYSNAWTNRLTLNYVAR